MGLLHSCPEHFSSEKIYEITEYYKLLLSRLKQNRIFLLLLFTSMGFFLFRPRNKIILVGYSFDHIKSMSKYNGHRMCCNVLTHIETKSFAVSAAAYGDTGDGENPSLPPNIVQQQQSASKETKEVISKPHRIKNYFSGTEHYDTLHRQAPQVSYFNIILLLYGIAY